MSDGSKIESEAGPPSRSLNGQSGLIFCPESLILVKIIFDLLKK